MGLAGGYEEQITRDKLYALIAAHELAGSLCNDIHLILLVRLLRIVSARCVNLDLERAMLKKRRPPPAIRLGNVLVCVLKGNSHTGLLKLIVQR